jgi:hypothetical protein
MGSIVSLLAHLMKDIVYGGYVTAQTTRVAAGILSLGYESSPLAIALLGLLFTH